MKKVNLTFANLTPAQAKTLADWYECQGEQDADIWFDEHCEDRVPRVDCLKEYTKDEEGNLTVYCE